MEPHADAVVEPGGPAMNIIDLHVKAIQIRNNIFGPPYSEEEITFLRTRADVEGWADWLAEVEAIRSRRKRRWLIRYILSGAIFITAYTVAEDEEGNLVVVDDPYEDDDPWEGM